MNHINNNNNNNNDVLEQEEAIAFNDALDDFIADVTRLDESITNETEVNEISDAMSWFREAINYNLPHGKRNRGIAVVVTHRILSEHLKRTPDLVRARIVGWCIELLQTHFLILDDIMDESLVRRGQKCWHLKQNVGSIAINDSFLMLTGIFDILDKHFSNDANFRELFKIFKSTMKKTGLGQNRDLLSSAKPGMVPDFRLFTKEKYDTIIDYKTAFYSFSAPIRLGMILSGVLDNELHEKADVILRKMGHVFQIQDDYLDCFGDPITIGKIGTDIEEGKCCWPIVTALSLANDQQKQILEQNYARKEKENVDAVKRVYNELGIEEIYNSYMRKSFSELSTLIDKFSSETDIPSEIFYSMLLKIYGRKK